MTNNCFSLKCARVILCILFIHVLIGCTINVRINNDSYGDFPSPKISKAVRPARVMTITMPLPFNEDIIFDDRGAKFDKSRMVFYGTVADSNYAEIHLNQIWYITFRITDQYAKSLTVDEYLALYEDMLDGIPHKVSMDESPFWDVIVFDGRGGEISMNKEKITGRTQKGTLVEIYTEEIYYAETTRGDIYKSLRSGLSLAGAVVFILGILHIF